MLNTVFTLKNCIITTIIGAFLFVVGCFGLGAAATSDNLYILLSLGCGAVVLIRSLYDLCRRLILRSRIQHSTEYEMMLEDFKIADSYMDNQVFLGKHYLFSAYAGLIVPCKNVTWITQEVSKSVRFGTSATVRANVQRRGNIVIAKYSFSGNYTDEINRLNKKVALNITSKAETE